LFSDPAGLHLDFRLREKRSHRTLTDDLQIHLLQLSYLQVTAETVYNASDEERWLMFLRDADKLTTEQIRQLFPDKEFAEAAGVLEMIAKTPEERMEYEARLKYRRDQAGRRQQALMEGRELGLVEGRAEGRQEGRITLMQEILGLPTSTPDELAACDASQLNQLAANLQQQLKARGF
jgi:predicted transposase/invertase (TIGR01784 family)